MKQKNLILLQAILVANLLFSTGFASAEAGEQKFTIAVIPDSQQEVLNEGDTRLARRLEWLVKSRQELNLKMVLHVGDLMNWDTPDHVQYKRASAAMTILDQDRVPYACALGNHDTAAVQVGGSAAPGNVNANLRVTTTYNTYFPVPRFRALQSVYEEGKVDNACHAFHAGGLDWLVINLELWARTGAVEWTEAVLEQHPHHNAIVLTHSHLNANGDIEPTKGGYGDNSPQYVFDRLRKHANLRFIFSGHTGKQAYRTDQGTHGNTIHQFLQCYHDSQSNPVRLLEIDVQHNTIKSWVYCPATDETKQDGSKMTITGVSWVPAMSTVSDRLHLPAPGRIVIRGHWAQPITNCLEHRVLAQDVAALVQPFRDRKDKTEWRSEFWGKWITSAELASHWDTDPRLRPLIERAVTNLLATQSADGYLGTYPPENHLWNWDIWGRKYTLLGLLGWHELTGDPTTLQAAQKVADHLLSEVGPQRPEVDMFRHDMWSGMACSSVIEPMVLLYRRTGDARYLKFAEWIVREWERPGGPDLMRKALRSESVFNMFPGPKPVIKDYMDVGHSKAYEMMSCLEGLLELHRVTGRAEFRDAAIRVFQNIADTEITAIGSGSDWERWCNGARRQTE
ncbi:MAG TPA: beta-L-arabinofuranosidase domain-containing protein, partial [Clostridia bacterium]|nr:beta-L-arabinofuranosidase domain-containing protein [Clostridia bacterium]